MGVEFRTFPTEKECLRYGDYYSSVGQARRIAARRMYEAAQARGEKRTFEEWIAATGRSYLFTPPANVPWLFHGGKRASKRASKRACRRTRRRVNRKSHRNRRTRR